MKKGCFSSLFLLFLWAQNLVVTMYLVNSSHWEIMSIKRKMYSGNFSFIFLPSDFKRGVPNTHYKKIVSIHTHVVVLVLS